MFLIPWNTWKQEADGHKDRHIQLSRHALLLSKSVDPLLVINIIRIIVSMPNWRLPGLHWDVGECCKLKRINKPQKYLVNKTHLWLHTSLHQPKYKTYTCLWSCACVILLIKIYINQGVFANIQRILKYIIATTVKFISDFGTQIEGMWVK